MYSIVLNDTKAIPSFTIRITPKNRHSFNFVIGPLLVQSHNLVKHVKNGCGRIILTGIFRPHQHSMS